MHKVEVRVVLHVFVLTPAYSHGSLRRYRSTMALYKYFAPAKPSLPKPDRPLSAAVPSSSIATANKEVTKVLEEWLDQKDATPKSARGEYEHFTPEEKVRIGKRAAEHGVTAAIRYFPKYFQVVRLKRVPYERGRRSTCKKYQEGNELVRL